MQRALRCLPARPTALTLAGPSQFVRILEDAASRAWLRRVSSQTNPHAGGVGSPSSESTKKGRAEGIFKRRNKISPRHSSEAEVNCGKPAELAHNSAYGVATHSLVSSSWAVGLSIPPTNDTEALLPDLTEPRPTHSPTSETSIISSLPFPHSPQMFYDNLIFASSSQPPPDVEELIRYHNARPYFQSPETYNICIDFAINHEQFDAANRLFDTMTKAEMYFNSVTYQLLVRLHARQFLEQAYDPSDRPILRKGSTAVMKMLSVIRDSDLATEPEEFLRRILDCLRPVFSGWEVHPKVVKAALYSIVNKDLTLASSELAGAYFSSLPAEIDEETKGHCLDMIHLLLSVDTKGGSTAFYDNQQLLITLLKTHRSLQPTSQTLFLLLSPLKKAKKPGTKAMKVLKSCRNFWGPEVVDERVRQLIMKLAKKEGRVDIVEQMRS